MLFGKKKKTLVLYYTQSMGNTRRIAEMVANAIGADIEAIETLKKYTGTYDDIMAQGKEEVESGFRPELKPLTHNLADYGRIILGAPTWWYSIAPAMYSFLEKNSMAGKTVVPFVTYGGYEGHALVDLQNACTGARIVNPKSIQFDSENLNQMVIPERELNEWIRTLE